LGLLPIKEQVLVSKFRDRVGETAAAHSVGHLRHIGEFEQAEAVNRLFDIAPCLDADADSPAPRTRHNKITEIAAEIGGIHMRRRILSFVKSRFKDDLATLGGAYHYVYHSPDLADITPKFELKRLARSCLLEDQEVEMFYGIAVDESPDTLADNIIRGQFRSVVEQRSMVPVAVSGHYDVRSVDPIPNMIRLIKHTKTLSNEPDNDYAPRNTVNQKSSKAEVPHRTIVDSPGRL
jgi:hypothetical protein